MQFTITMVDYAPPDLEHQLPLVVDLVRELPGDDRPDYWIAAADTPIQWLDGNHALEITHIIMAARWQGTRIEVGATDLPVCIAYVLDPALLTDARLDLKKSRYVAIGLASDTTGGKPLPASSIVQAGHIAPAFGTGGAPGPGAA